MHKWRNDTTKSVLMISTIIMPGMKLLTSCVLIPYTSWDLWVWTVNTIAACRLQCRERWLAERKWIPRFDWSLQWNRISCPRDAWVFYISHKFLHPVWLHHRAFEEVTNFMVKSCTVFFFPLYLKAPLWLEDLFIRGRKLGKQAPSYVTKH